LAQAAGAVGVVMVNNGSPFLQMQGDASDVTIPCVLISQSDGNAIRSAIGSGTVVMTLTADPSRFAGADALGRALLYAPNPVEQGSSISHWDVSATPDLLMEPAINSDLTSNVDLTTDALVDMGWTLGGGSGPGGGGDGKPHALAHLAD